jgi:hypothetical protein
MSPVHDGDKLSVATGNVEQYVQAKAQEHLFRQQH